VGRFAAIGRPARVITTATGPACGYIGQPSYRSLTTARLSVGLRSISKLSLRPRKYSVINLKAARRSDVRRHALAGDNEIVTILFATPREPSAMGTKCEVPRRRLYFRDRVKSGSETDIS
jgi:hypothetical protein